MTRRFVWTLLGTALVVAAWFAYRGAAATLLLGDSLFICG